MEGTQGAKTVDMQERMDFLKKDLDNLFNDRGVDKSQYDNKVEFMDPITKYGSVQGEFPATLLPSSNDGMEFLLHGESCRGGGSQCGQGRSVIQ